MENILELPSFMKSMKALKFIPTDQVLVEHYLYNKLHGMVYFRDVVFDYNLYGAVEPWQIWEGFNGVDGRDLYFFTQLKRSTNKSGQSSSHVNRKVGSAGGTWSAENSLTPVFATDSNDQIIGYCRRLRYENPQMPEHHGEWIMHEYSLHESYIQENCPCPNYVLCRIRKNERVKRKEEKVTRSTMTPMGSNERSSKRVKNIGFFVSQPVEQYFECAQPSLECAPQRQQAFERALHQVFECAPHHDSECAPHQAFEYPPHQAFERAPQQYFECAPHQAFEHQAFECAPVHQDFECAPHQTFEYAPSLPHHSFEYAPSSSFEQSFLGMLYEPEMTTDQGDEPVMIYDFVDCEQSVAAEPCEPEMTTNQVDVPNLDEILKGLEEADVRNLDFEDWDPETTSDMF